MVGGLLLATMIPLASSAASIKISRARFPDLIFMEYVKTFDTNTDDYLSDSEIAAVKTINVAGKGIKSLSGIQYFTNLEKLTINFNSIGALDFSKNTKIKEIYCYRNRISQTGLRKLISSLPKYEGTTFGKIYFRYDYETEERGMNTESWDIYAANRQGWKGYMFNSSTGREEELTFHSLPIDVNATNFPDPNFRACIEALGYGTHIPYTRIDEITSLDVSNKGIKSLKGIEKLTALRDLNCGNNELTSLDLSYNAYIHSVTCWNNRIFGTEMEKLVESLPGPPVWIEQTENSGVASYFNPFYSTSSEGNTMTGSQISTCNGKFFVVFKSNSEIYTSEEEIPLFINNVTFPDATFRNFIKSQSYGKDGKITAAEIANLTSLSTGNSEISSVAGIEYFSALKDLTLNGQTNMASIDIKRNTKLENLECSNNKLQSLDLSKNTKLQTLRVNDTKLSSLNLNPVKNTLTLLDCGWTNITSLDLSALSKLTDLYCINCGMNSLNVASNTALKVLDCSENNLQTLDLPMNTQLTSLYCSSNKLTTLSLSSNTALKTLYCNSNQLQSLNLASNRYIETLDCSYNKLRILSLPTIQPTVNPTALLAMYFQGNQFDETFLTSLMDNFKQYPISRKIYVYDNTLGREGNAFSYAWRTKLRGVSAFAYHYEYDNPYIYDYGNSLFSDESFNWIAGTQVTMPIELETNKDNLYGFTFDLVLPDGITLTKAEGINFLSGRNVSYTKDATYPDVYHITVAPSHLITQSGTAMELTLNLTKRVYDNIRLQNIIFKLDAEGAFDNHIVGPLTTHVYVKNSILGDVNSDTSITPADAIMILYYYFGVQQQGFNKNAADMNNDGSITPADAIEVLYKYFGANGARATKPASLTESEDLDPE